MSGFQLVALIALGGLLVRELVGLVRGSPGGRVRLARCGVWSAAAVAILQPDLVQRAAELLGIGRGADAVLYLFVLAFLWVSFALYSSQLRLQRQLTQVVRHVAIREAVRGTPRG
jgi:small membrane protein